MHTINHISDYGVTVVINKDGGYVQYKDTVKAFPCKVVSEVQVLRTFIEILLERENDNG